MEFNKQVHFPCEARAIFTALKLLHLYILNFGYVVTHSTISYKKYNTDTIFITIFNIIVLRTVS